MKIKLVDKFLSGADETDSIKLVGNCDIIIQGMESGSVTLQYKLKKTDVLVSPTWEIHPNGIFTENTAKTVFISDYGNRYKLVSVDTNAETYARLSYFINKSNQ